MTTLYVRDQGACVRRTGERLKVVKGDSTIHTARLRDVERLVLFGNVEVTASAQAALLASGVETVLLSFAGKYRGRLVPSDGKNIFLRQAQFKRYEDAPFRLHTARVILDAKIRNARYVLQRHQWNHAETPLDATIQNLEKTRVKLASQARLETLLGVEGEAARQYFAAFGAMLRADFGFTVRSRRPPRDPANAMLSFGYTLLCTELTGALAAQGLDPHVGVLHELDYGRPSLALDLLEEFRQPVIDRLVLSLINRGVVQSDHFQAHGDSGVYLNDAGRARFLEFYHRSLETQFADRETGAKTTYRELLLRQARRMRGALLDEAAYIAFDPR